MEKRIAELVENIDSLLSELEECEGAGVTLQAEKYVLEQENIRLRAELKACKKNVKQRTGPARAAGRY